MTSYFFPYLLQLTPFYFSFCFLLSSLPSSIPLCILSFLLLLSFTPPFYFLIVLKPYTKSTGITVLKEKEKKRNPHLSILFSGNSLAVFFLLFPFLSVVLSPSLV